MRDTLHKPRCARSWLLGRSSGITRFASRFGTNPFTVEPSGDEATAPRQDAFRTVAAVRAYGNVSFFMCEGIRRREASRTEYYQVLRTRSALAKMSPPVALTKSPVLAAVCDRRERARCC